MKVAKARLAARWLWLDFRRQPRMALRVTAQPLVMIALFAAVPVLFAVAGASSTHASTHTVAVEPAAPPEVRDALRQANLRVITASAAAAAIGDVKASVGVGFSAGRVTVLYDGGDAGARVAAADVDAALRRILDPGAVHVNAPEVIRAAPVDTRRVLARFVPGVILLAVVGAAATAGQLVTGARADRSIEVLLVLPFARGELVAGQAWFASVVGALGGVGLLVPCALASAAVAPTASSAVVAGIGVLLAAAAVLPALTEVGLIVGARVPSAVAVQGVLGGFAAVTVGTEYLPDLTHLTAAFALPVIGPVVCARAAIAGTLSAGQASTAAAGAVVTALLLGWAAAAALGDSAAGRTT